MKKNTIVLVAAAATVAWTAVEYAKFVKEQKEEQRRIQAEGQKNIAAVIHAANTVTDRLNSGEYHGKSFRAVLDDLAFYETAYHLEK